MSEPTGPATPSRPPVIPTLLGLLLVAVVIAGASAIERATDGGSDLPERLDGGFRASDVADDRLGDEQEARKFADRQAEMLDSTGERLEEVLDESVTMRRYQSEGAEQQVTIIVIDAAAGPFAPNGARPDPSHLGVARDTSELVREGDAVCNVVWTHIVPEGEEIPDDDPAGVGCQLGHDGRTYWIDSRGLAVDDTVELLESVTD